jgi:hypothetical protein
MARWTSDWFNLWTAPLEWARTGAAVMETAVNAQAVIAARMPIIAGAMLSPWTAAPWTAEGRELGLMVSEKIDAVGRSAGSRSGKRLRAALNGQAAAMGRLGGGSWFGPADWFAMAERSTAIAAAMIALPGEMWQPFHTGAAANARRLGRR